MEIAYYFKNNPVFMRSDDLQKLLLGVPETWMVCLNQLIDIMTQILSICLSLAQGVLEKPYWY